MTFCTLWQTLRETLWRFSGRTEIICSKSAIERFYCCLVTLLPRGKGTFPKESAEASINSYCQGQAVRKKNIICPNEQASDYRSEVWLSVAPLERDGWLVVGFDHYCDLIVPAYKAIVRMANLLFRGSNWKKIWTNFGQQWILDCVLN